MMNISIVLVDDHAVVRQGLRGLLERELGYTVVGEAADGPAAMELIAQHKPDVLVVDLIMPRMSGLELIRQVHQSAPQTHMVVLSMHADPVYVREALRAGAIGYILKEAPASELIQAVREAAQGRSYLGSVLTGGLLDSYFQEVGVSVADPYELLTDSERAVLKLAAQGHTAAAIAERLSLSPRTVETYRANLLHKLDLRNQTELVRYAIKRGLIPLE
jgi:DNA-binding NarL/FixJ family response regulator